MLGNPRVAMRTDGKVWCEGCGEWYFPALAWKHGVCVVANKPVVVANRVDLVANESPVVANTEVELVANKHGVYADRQKRREYMRQYMAKRRKEMRNGDSH